MADNEAVFALVDSKLGELQTSALGYADDAIAAAEQIISYAIEQAGFETKPRWRAEYGSDGDPGKPNASLGHLADLSNLPGNMPTLTRPTLNLTAAGIHDLMPATDLYKYYSVLFDTYLENKLKDIVDNNGLSGTFADPTVQNALFAAGANRNLRTLSDVMAQQTRQFSSRRAFPVPNTILSAMHQEATTRHQDNEADRVNEKTRLIAERLHDARKHAIDALLKMEGIRAQVYGQFYGHYFAIVSALVEEFKTKAEMEIREYQQELEYLKRLDQNDQFDVSTEIHNDKMWQEQQIRRLLAQVEQLGVKQGWDRHSLSERCAAAKFGAEQAARLFTGTSGMLNAVDLNDKTGTA